MSVYKNPEDEGFERLANAIVIRACYDFLKAEKELKEDPDDYQARKTADACRAFFNSPWFDTLTTIGGDFITNLAKGDYRLAPTATIYAENYTVGIIL